MEIHEVPVVHVAPLAKRHESDKFHYTTSLKTTKAADWRLLGVAWPATVSNSPGKQTGNFLDLQPLSLGCPGFSLAEIRNSLPRIKGLCEENHIPLYNYIIHIRLGLSNFGSSECGVTCVMHLPAGPTTCQSPHASDVKGNWTTGVDRPSRPPQREPPAPASCVASG